jgi:MFS family permease
VELGLTEPSGLRRIFIAFRYRDYRYLVISQLISALSTEFLNTSNAWQIYALTGSAVQLGLTGIARAIPVIAFSLVGGVIADRVDRRKIIIFSQVGSSLTALALAALSATGRVQPWHIFLVIFVNNTMSSAAMPARRAVLATVVPREHLMNAMATNSMLNQPNRIGAPALAGVLIAAFGTPVTYGLNGIFLLVNAVTLSRLQTDLKPEASGASPVKDLVEGLQFVRSHSIILVILLMDAAANVAGNFVVLFPILAARYAVGAVGFGLFGSAQAAGRLSASFGLMALGDFKRKGILIGVSLLVYAGFLIVLGLSPWFWLALLAVAGLGFSDGLQAQTRNVLVQLLTPNALRGRVSSFGQMLQNGGPALGQGVLGAMAAALGAPLALVTAGVICGTLNLAIFLARGDLRAPNLGIELPTSRARPPTATARGEEPVEIPSPR